MAYEWEPNYEEENPINLFGGNTTWNKRHRRNKRAKRATTKSYKWARRESVYHSGKFGIFCKRDILVREKFKPLVRSSGWKKKKYIAISIKMAVPNFGNIRGFFSFLLFSSLFFFLTVYNVDISRCRRPWKIVERNDENFTVVAHVKRVIRLLMAKRKFRYAICVNNAIVRYFHFA